MSKKDNSGLYLILSIIIMLSGIFYTVFISTIIYRIENKVYIDFLFMIPIIIWIILFGIFIILTFNSKF